MRKKYFPKIPKKPFLKRQTYNIPQPYLETYNNKDITNPDEQMILFHLTQFGGFKLKRIPKDMILSEGFIDKWCRSEFEGKYMNYKSSSDFLLSFGDINLRPLERVWKKECVNDKEMSENGFSHEEIMDSVRFLNKLNSFYFENVRLDIEIPNSGITAKDRIDLSKFHAIPYLVKKPKAGGRFFHPESSYQRVPSELRSRLTINCEKTCEIDLCAATMQFLDITLEKNSLESIKSTILSNGDPYGYFLLPLNSQEFLMQHREQEIDRESIKNLVYTVIYSEPKKRKTNLNRRLRLMGRSYTSDDFLDLFPEFFNSLSQLNNGTKQQTHSVIYKEESRYAQRVLEKGALEKKLPIIPLHDSFITTISLSEPLKEIMDDASKELYGRRLKYKQKF